MCFVAHTGPYRAPYVCIHLPTLPVFHAPIVSLPFCQFLLWPRRNEPISSRPTKSRAAPPHAAVPMCWRTCSPSSKAALCALLWLSCQRKAKTKQTHLPSLVHAQPAVAQSAALHLKQLRYDKSLTTACLRFAWAILGTPSRLRVSSHAFPLYPSVLIRTSPSRPAQPSRCSPHNNPQCPCGHVGDDGHGPRVQALVSQHWGESRVTNFAIAQLNPKRHIDQSQFDQYKCGDITIFNFQHMQFAKSACPTL